GLQESLVHTTAGVKAAYWNLVSARATVDARRSALELAQELVRVNKAKVDVGTSPPLDLVSAQAEVASDQEQLIIAETSVKQAEDRLRVLIFDPTVRDNWNVQIDTVDSPPVGTATLDVEAAVTRALGQSAEQANAARAKLERSQSAERLKSAQSKAILQVRDAGWKVEMNAKRIETTRLARELADQRLDAERKRFEVGMSTSFLVIQAQRDLAQAKTNEVSAVLSYDLSLVDYEALQQAGPAGQSS